MPSLQELRRRGRADLAYAISKLGGIARAAEQCGLRISQQRYLPTQQLTDTIFPVPGLI